jgi:hypothetical protein
MFKFCEQNKRNWEDLTNLHQRRGGQPMRVTNEIKQNKMATKKEDYFLKSNEKKGNDVKWNFFKVDILIAI